MGRASLAVAVLAILAAPASAQTATTIDRSSLFPQPMPLTHELAPGSGVVLGPGRAPVLLQEDEETDEVLKYIGVGLMVVGGINTLYGLSCVATAHTWGNYCWPYLTISVGMGVGGWVLYKRNR